MNSLTWRVVFLAGVLACASVLPARGADTVIVYDASNSMWGQIDGEAKVLIARRVLADLIRSWDEDIQIGLVAYGHRRAGECTDIETVATVGPVDREALIAKINTLQPRGMTPLTDAVRHAAEELKFRDTPATVVLVSDGIETCDADPCAVAEELSLAGIRFTAHVIGFDVTAEADQAQLRCIAENTGGRFFAAGDAGALQAALSEVAQIAAEPEPEPEPEPEVTISAPESAVAGSRVEITWAGETRPRDYVTIVPVDAPPDAYRNYQRVRDDFAAVITAPAEPGPHEARYVSHTSGRAVASAPVEIVEQTVTLSAPESVAGGAQFTVQWENAIHPQDYVTIVPADAAPDQYGAYIRVRNDVSGNLTAPAEPGAYEVRYLLHESNRAIASVPIEVIEQVVSVSAPESVAGGAQFTVQWENAIHPQDYVTIVPADAAPDQYGAYIRVRNDVSGNLTAPAEPGTYEVRYLLHESNRAIASVPIEVIEQVVSVSAPEAVSGGAQFTVKWENAIHPQDYVTIVRADAAADQYGGYIRVRNNVSGNLTAPAEPGAYEVRYLLHASNRAIASAPVAVSAPETALEAPATVVAESRFTVAWSDWFHPQDYVTIVPPDAPLDQYGAYIRVRGQSSGTLTAPAEPGTYEVRYLLHESNRAIASVPLVVE